MVRKVLAGLLLVPLFAAMARGQSNRERFDNQLDLIRRDSLQKGAQDVPAGQRVLFDYGAYFTFDYLTVDDSSHDNHVLRQYDTVAYARLNLDGAQELFLRGRATYRDFNKDDSFDGRGSRLLDPDLDRGYYRFDLARWLQTKRGQDVKYDVIFQGGRDLAYWANGLTLGEVLDGGMLTATAGPLSLSAVAGITPVRTIDIDSSRPSFDANTRRGFFGAMLSAQVGVHRPFAYVLSQRDYNRDQVFTLPPTTTRFDYNSYYIGVGSTGSLTDKLIYSFEGVYEGGDTLSSSFTVNGAFLNSVPQTRNDIEAYAGDARLDYLFNDPHRTRASAEALITSGDRNRLTSTNNTFGGSAPGTVDHAFNGVGLINTGVAFAASPSNIGMLRLGVSTFPLANSTTFRRLQTGADFFIYEKTVRDAPIDEPTAHRRYLGWEPDFFVNWQISSDVTLAVRYGVFFPSDRAFTTTDARQFFSTSITFAF